MRRDPGHPVWDVYDLLRTARLNVKYYSCRVSALQRHNFVVEIIIAATTSGSAIAGLAFWNEPLGRSAWQVLTVIAAVLAIAKPLLKLTDRIQTFEELVGEYRGAEYELKKIEVAVRQRKTFDAELQNRFASAMDQMAEIAKRKGGEFNTRTKLRDRCQKEVARELPANRFFVPEEAVT